MGEGRGVVAPVLEGAAVGRASRIFGLLHVHDHHLDEKPGSINGVRRRGADQLKEVGIMEEGLVCDFRKIARKRR